MDLIQSILMGIVQGLSEFLPISSSAHLVFTSNFYKVFKGIEIVQESNQEVFLDIMLHLGTLIAVLIFFRKEIWAILKALYFGLKNKDYSSKDFNLYIKTKKYTQPGEKDEKLFLEHKFECTQNQIVLTNSSARVIKEPVH